MRSSGLYALEVFLESWLGMAGRQPHSQLDAATRRFSSKAGLQVVVASYLRSVRNRLPRLPLLVRHAESLVGVGREKRCSREEDGGGVEDEAEARGVRYVQETTVGHWLVQEQGAEARNERLAVRRVGDVWTCEAQDQRRREAMPEKVGSHSQKGE